MNTSRTTMPIPPVALSSLPSSPCPSPIPLSSARLSRLARENDSLLSYTDLRTHSNERAPLASPVLSPPSPTLLYPDEPKPRIPRPPNAFMIFRSDFLARKVVPKTTEKRQQELSRVVGECWNLMSDEEKKVWHDKAAERLREHQQKYPGYKFTPAPRGSSRKGKNKGDEEGTDDERVRKIRETFTHHRGPAIAPARRRKGKQRVHTLQKDKDTAESDPSMKAIMVPLPASMTSSPVPTPPDSAHDVPPSLPPFFPEPSYPHLDLAGGQTPNYHARPGFQAYVNSGYPLLFLSPPVLANASSASSSDGEVARQVSGHNIASDAADSSCPSPANASSVDPRQLCYTPSFDVYGQGQPTAPPPHPTFTDGQGIFASGSLSGPPAGTFNPMCYLTGLDGTFEYASGFDLPSFPLDPDFLNLDEWNFGGGMDPSPA